MSTVKKMISLSAVALLLSTSMSQSTEVRLFNQQQCSELLKLVSVCERRARISYSVCAQPSSRICGENSEAGDRFTECAHNYLVAYHTYCPRDEEAEFMNQVFSNSRAAVNAGSNGPLKAEEAERLQNSSRSDSAAGNSAFDVGDLIVGLTALAGIYAANKYSVPSSRMSCGPNYFNHLGVCMPYGRGSPSYVPRDRPSDITR